MKKMREVLKFVRENEDSYYAKITCGANPLADLQNVASAVAFQKTRYFIESIFEPAWE